jgi:hypothetical protein
MDTTNAVLPEDLFAVSRLPARDNNGFLFHPDLELIDKVVYDGEIFDEGEACFKYIQKLGYEHACIQLEYDASDEISARYFESGNPNCSDWEPSKPEGEGWMLAWITDTEDGPVAVYLRLAKP